MIRAETVKFEIQREEQRINRARAGHRARRTSCEAASSFSSELARSELVFVRKLPQHDTRAVCIYEHVLGVPARVEQATWKMERRMQGCVTLRARRCAEPPSSKVRAWENIRKQQLKVSGLSRTEWGFEDTAIKRSSAAWEELRKKVQEEDESLVNQTIMEFLWH